MLAGVALASGNLQPTAAGKVRIQPNLKSRSIEGSACRGNTCYAACHSVCCFFSSHNLSKWAMLERHPDDDRAYEAKLTTSDGTLVIPSALYLGVADGHLVFSGIPVDGPGRERYAPCAALLALP